jgi:twitching motility protein PilT
VTARLRATFRASSNAASPRRASRRPPRRPPAVRPVPASPVLAPATKNAATFSPNRALAGWLSDARSAGASDLHLVAGRPVLLRVGGELVPRGEPVDAAAVEGMILGSVPPRLAEVLARTGSCDYALALARFGRFRVNVARQRTGLKACLRLIASEIPTLESLGLPPEIAKATEHHQGLIVVTGPTGHGKTTTLAAIVDIFNRDTSHHVITVEDPVEFVHPRKRALISQREVGTHTRSFASALKAALREDPDVIVVGEMRDQETVRMALSASETGHLVIGTMNTPSAARTIERLIDLFPAGEHPQVRVTLASGLRLIVGQRLVPTPDRARRRVAAELLPGSIALSNLIRDGKTYQIPSLQQRGRGIGIIRLDDSLADLVRAGTIAMADAARYAEAPEELEATVKSPGHLPAAPLAPPVGANAAMPALPPIELDEPGVEPRGLMERAGAFFSRRGR